MKFSIFSTVLAIVTLAVAGPIPEPEAQFGGNCLEAFAPCSYDFQCCSGYCSLYGGNYGECEP
ncbi:unnamed protein product [Cercospora beticola]|nr:unnamed protein product [Cercospora beticola]